MKTEELQIGDWASLKDTGDFYQVTEIGEEFIMLGYAHECYYKEVEPIPLTAEILEKNGFKKFEDPLYGKGYELELANKFTNDDVCVYFRDKRLEVKIYRLDDNLRIIVATLDVYVHTLQHAMRLCGIDKEIEL